jgi:small nuclear ribonucleoprotein (snRNP)-like protein
MKWLSKANSQGFDEYMNVVMDDATEVYTKTDQPSVPLGEKTPFIGLLALSNEM